MKKVLVIGDSSVNVFLQIPSSTDNVSIENNNRLMQFRLGSKTQLEKEVITVGGNALNVAVGLGRQGIDVDFYSIIGKDADGDRIMNFFSFSTVIPAPFSNGVNSSGIQDLDSGFRQNDNKINLKIERQEGLKTNVGYAINYNSERFLLIDTSTKNYEIPPSPSPVFGEGFGEAQWVFLSSIGSDYVNTFRTLIEHKNSSNCRLAYNPSSNELKNPVETYVKMIEISDILFVNKKEAIKIIEELLHCSIVSLLKTNSSIRVNPLEISENPSPEMQLLLQELYKLNSKIVIITDGIRGSFAFDGGKAYFEASSGEIPIEKTGAGDAYESGFLAQYLKTGDIQAAMRNGTENAASVIKFVGAVEGLQYKI